jgi:hypothetical protein
MFETDQSLFKVLLDAVSNTLQKMLKDKHSAMPGIVCVLHPYGKTLNLNPSVHVLFTEGGLTNEGKWVRISFLEYRSLRRIWQYQLLTLIKQALPRSLENSCLVHRLFEKHKDGFYVYAKSRVSKPRRVAAYMGRYLRHPAIAESRISEFDVESNMVTYWYVDECRVKRFVTVSALVFIGCLVRLIVDKHLKLIRYYGLYSRRTRGVLQKVLTSLSREKVVVRSRRVVVLCSECGGVMVFLFVCGFFWGGLVVMVGC